MNVFLYLAIPMAIAGLAQYALTLFWPKVPTADAPAAARGNQAKPAVKGAAESEIVDRGHRLVREQARKEERAPAASVPEPETFAIPEDFNMAEYSSHRE